MVVFDYWYLLISYTECLIKKKRYPTGIFFLSIQNYIMYYGNIKQEGDLVKQYIRTLQ